MTIERSCWHIATAGPMGSGKTTLARTLARRLGWTYVPETAPALAYLEDLFNDIHRWAFETQASFLVHKATQTLALLHRDRDIIVDRTLYEDVEVFAGRFRELGHFDERVSTTYDALARYFLDEIGPPDLVIYCDCAFELAQARRGERGRKIDSRYPEGHVEAIWKKTKEWADGYSHGPFATLDTGICDVREGHPGEQAVVTDLVGLLSRTEAGQLSLFSDPYEKPARPPVLTVRGTTAVPRRALRMLRPALGASIEGGSTPIAYIAAPFSGVTTITDRATGDSLFELTAPHGTIEKGPYRTMLEAVSRKLRGLHFSPVLPHRDVNKWGFKVLRPADVVRMCTEHVRRCSFFVGILGESHGSHYEFGLARGMDKPAVVISCGELKASFIASGMDSSLGRVLRLDCDKITDIPALLDTEAFRLFVARFF